MHDCMHAGIALQPGREPHASVQMHVLGSCSLQATVHLHEGHIGADSGPDAFLLEALFRNEAWSHLNAPMSEENEGAVCRSMIDGCRCG